MYVLSFPLSSYNIYNIGHDCGLFPSSFKFGGVNRNVGGPHRLSDPAWKHAGGRCIDRADDLCTGLTRDVATTQHTQHLDAAVRMRGTGAASPRTQSLRSRIVDHGRSVSFDITNGRSITWGRVRIPGSGEPKWNNN